MHVQGALDAYFLKARGAGESQKQQDACNAAAAEAVGLLQQLRGARGSAAPAQRAAMSCKQPGQTRGPQIQGCAAKLGKARKSNRKKAGQREKDECLIGVGKDVHS